MILDGLKIPGKAYKLVTFHRNGGKFAPEQWKVSSGMVAALLRIMQYTLYFYKIVAALFYYDYY